MGKQKQFLSLGLRTPHRKKVIEEDLLKDVIGPYVFTANERSGCFSSANIVNVALRSAGNAHGLMPLTKRVAEEGGSQERERDDEGYDARDGLERAYSPGEGRQNGRMLAGDIRNGREMGEIRQLG